MQSARETFDAQAEGRGQENVLVSINARTQGGYSARSDSHSSSNSFYSNIIRLILPITFALKVMYFKSGDELK